MVGVVVEVVVATRRVKLFHLQKNGGSNYFAIHRRRIHPSQTNDRGVGTRQDPEEKLVNLRSKKASFQPKDSLD